MRPHLAPACPRCLLQSIRHSRGESASVPHPAPSSVPHPAPVLRCPTTSVSLLHAFATLTVSDGRAPVPRLRRPYATLPLAPHRAARIYHLRLGGLLLHRRPGTCAWWAPDPGAHLRPPPPVELQSRSAQFWVCAADIYTIYEVGWWCAFDVLVDMRMR